MGITQPLVYEISQFFVIFDNDFTDTEYFEYGEIVDTTPDDSEINGILQVRNLEVSNLYLTSELVDYQFNIYLASSMPTILYGQTI